MRKIKDQNCLTFILSLIVTMFVAISLIWFYFNNLMKIPNGIVLGSLINAFSYLALSLIKEKEERERTIKYTIIVNAIRFVLLITSILVSAVLEYKNDINVINPIAIAGGYMIPLMIHIISALIMEKKNVRR